MDVVGVDRFWFKTTIDKNGVATVVLAVLTSVPLHPAESGYEAGRAKEMMESLRRFQLANGIDAVEVLRGAGG